MPHFNVSFIMLIESPTWSLRSKKKRQFFTETSVKGTVSCIVTWSTTGICIDSDREKSSTYYVAWWQLNNSLQHCSDFSSVTITLVKSVQLSSALAGAPSHPSPAPRSFLTFKPQVLPCSVSPESTWKYSLLLNLSSVILFTRHTELTWKHKF